MLEAPDSTNATPSHMLGHVLRPEELLTRTRYRFAEPAEDLRLWVERYWSVEWNFEEEAEHSTATLDDPATNLTVERGTFSRRGAAAEGVWFTGPGAEERMDVRLFGSGSVVGIRFRPGACFAFSDDRFRLEADVTQLAEPLFSGSEALLRAPRNASDAAAVLDAWLLQRMPTDTAELRQLRAMLATLEAYPLDSMESIASRIGCSQRTMQRQFSRLVGVTPKRIRMRARVFRAAEHIERDWSDSMADLAAALGWFDQAHFVRDFKSVTGMTPAAYAADRTSAG